MQSRRLNEFLTASVMRLVAVVLVLFFREVLVHPVSVCVRVRGHVISFFEHCRFSVILVEIVVHFGMRIFLSDFFFMLDFYVWGCGRGYGCLLYTSDAADE